MKVWRKRIIGFSFRDNPSSPVFAHTLLAMSLLGGYLVLGLGTAGVLAYVGLRTDSTRGPWHHLLVQFCGIAGAVISASTYPAWRRFVAPGSKLVRQDQPRLFERIDRIASLFGQQPPSEIYLTDDVDVGVCQEGGFMGFGAKNVICLGLPVFHFLTVSQLDAVLAQTFAHFRGRHHRVWPWLRETRDSLDVAKGMMNYYEKWMILPLLFNWYEKLFTRVARHIFGTQRFAADRSAAVAIGPRIYGEALLTIARNQGAFTEFLYHEVRPAVGRGYHPPVMEGFNAFLAFAGPRQQPEKIREDPEGGSLSVADRLAAIRDLPAGPSGDPSPAISLLNNVPELEMRLLLLEAPSGTEELRSIPWTQAASCSVLPNWHALCRLHAFKLIGLTLGDLPRTIADLDSYGVLWGPDADVEVARECSKSLIIAALGRILTCEGWYIDHSPGYLRLRRLNDEIDPTQLLEEMASPGFSPEAWHEMLSRWDLDPTLPLGVSISRCADLSVAT